MARYFSPIHKRHPFIYYALSALQLCNWLYLGLHPRLLHLAAFGVESLTALGAVEPTIHLEIAA